MKYNQHIHFNNNIQVLLKSNKANKFINNRTVKVFGIFTEKTSLTCLPHPPNLTLTYNTASAKC